MTGPRSRRTASLPHPRRHTESTRPASGSGRPSPSAYGALLSCLGGCWRPSSVAGGLEWAGGSLGPEAACWEFGTMGEIALAVVTLALVVATLLLWFEAHKLSTEASVIVWAAPWEVAGGLYVAILVQNAGPVVARDVTVSWRLERPGGTVEGRLREPAMDVGFRRTILVGRDKLDELAADGASIVAHLTWHDRRRGTHTQDLTVTVRQIQEDYNSSGALPRPSQLEILDQIRDELKALVKKEKPRSE